MIPIDKFTELAHRTASRYSHRSDPARAFYTFSQEALADFHRQVCSEAASRASLEAVPDGWRLVPIRPTREMLVAANNGDVEYTRRNFGNVPTIQQGPEDHWAAMLSAAPAQPAQQSKKGTNDVELDCDSNNSITGQQRDLARALEVGQRVVQSRKQDRSDPDAEKELNLIVKAISAPIAVEVAKNCRSVPQLTFPHIALGLTDLILSVAQANTDQSAQQERQP